MIWFTSDEHYGHLNIIKFCNRPFATVEEMTEELIRRHNERVRPGDLVYHLGDMFWRTLTVQQCMEILDRLNGKQHYYIWGNHEEIMEHNVNLSRRFVWCQDLTAISPPGHPKIVLCHYAMRTWRGSHRNTWQLYGHTHAALPESADLSFDVGVDAWDYYPVSIEEVAYKMATKQANREAIGGQRRSAVISPEVIAKLTEYGDYALLDKTVLAQMDETLKEMKTRV